MSTSRKIMRGEIYYIKNFPTVGSEQRSGRPAVIVSNNENNTHSGTYEICYLTLKDKPNLPTHVYIDQGPCINSTVLCEQITTVAEDKIGDYMCRIPDYLEEPLNKALAVSLGISTTIEFTSEDSKGIPVEMIDKFNSIKAENLLLSREIEASRKNMDDYKLIKSKADMYERMYNDLLDRLVKRG